MLDAGTGQGEVDVLYPVGDGIYIHVHGPGSVVYTAIEPPLDADGKGLVTRLRDAILSEAMYLPLPVGQEGLEREILSQFTRITARGAEAGIRIPAEARDAILYHLVRDIARYGPLQPLFLDPYLEDIQGVGMNLVHVVHKFYGMLETNIRFQDPESLDRYLTNLSERVGRPVSDSSPIVDATLFDGSRINIVYSDDVSRKGPSFSIRRAQEEPITITQLIAWKTLTPQMAAYLWLCLENGMSVFVCGEAACGKTSTLNALLSFINPKAKLYTAEDTPEIRVPHPVWQRLLTRESGPEESRVRMFDLLKTALRSRPNYIVVGEIRGAEGAVAFQAMQTGHPTVATFHASDKVKMIQRLTAEPINIPLSFIDNLNVAVFQGAFSSHGRYVRRITSVDELEGYSEADGGVMTRPVFIYDPSKDDWTFRGNQNSYILERKIAEQHGYEDPRQIYVDLERRARILEKMVEHRILRHEDVCKLLIDYAERGPAALPFEVS